MNNNDFRLDRIKLCILDVDGTLYEQRKIQIIMLFHLLWNVIITLSFDDVRIIWQFRKARESLSLAKVSDIQKMQYFVVAKELGVTDLKVSEVVEQWMHAMPLKYLKRAKRRDLDNFLSFLKEKNIKFCLWSDYPCEKKAKALEIFPDKCFDNSDPSINILKPDPKGLTTILNYYMLQPSECFAVGDRFEKDWESANSIGLQCFIISHLKNVNAFKSFDGILSYFKGVS